MIRSEPLKEEKEICCLNGEERRYVRIKTYEGEGKTLGIVIDVTEAIVENSRSSRNAISTCLPVF